MSDPEMTTNFTPLQLIEEVKQRPGLYDPEQPVDRLERLQLWKEIGAALFPDWGTFNKTTMYHTVLQIQRKWRSLRDAYNRELRTRRSGTRVQRRVYIYFKKMSFLGGYDGALSDEEEVGNCTVDQETYANGNSTQVTLPRKKRKRIKKSSSDSDQPPDEIEMPMFNNVEVHGDMDTDTDKLFLLSFLPEMRQLPINIKMWTRAQIANIMQEAVSCHFNNAQPGGGGGGGGAVKQRRDSSD
ncbi:uncharacterized protein [Battus philenor]|uniref:uncharacterized protein n=1 Tax=Battus philenor TaxID=42288 RepID=UPI0035D0C9C1